MTRIQGMGHDYGAATRLSNSPSWDEQLAFEEIWYSSCVYRYLANAAPGGGVDGVYSSNGTCKTAGTAHSQTNREIAIT